MKPPAHRVHQTTVPGGVGPQSSHLRDPYRLKVSQSSTNHLPPPQTSGFGSHQVASEASPHPGLPFQNLDRVAGLSTGDHPHSLPPGYDHLMDTSLQLSNLSTQNLNFVVRGENLDPTDATLAIDSGSSKVPRHPLNGQLKIDLGQSEVSTLLGPNRRVKNVWPSDLQHQRRHDPLRFPPQALHSSGQSDKCETYPPATTRPATLGKMDPLRSASQERVSSARSQSQQNLDRPGSAEWSSRNALKSKVHNVRVKPPSRFVSSANPLRQKPKVLPLNSAPTDSSSQERGADGGREGKRAQTVDLGRTSTTHQQMHRHSPVHSNQNLLPPVSGTEHGGWLGSGPAPRNVAQAAGKFGDSPVDVQDSLDGGNWRSHLH